MEEVAFALKTRRDRGRGFWELIAGTEVEGGRDLQSPRKELSQVTSSVSGHRGSPLSPSPILALHTQSPGHAPPWQQEPFESQLPRQASGRAGGQEEGRTPGSHPHFAWGWSFFWGRGGRGMPWRSAGRRYSIQGL